MIAVSAPLKESHHRALKEIAVRGTSDAAAGLSEMTGRSIRMQAVEVSTLSIEEVPGLLETPEEMVAGVYLTVSGDLNGHILLLFSPLEARRLVDMLMALAPGSTTALGPMERSALGEVGNVAGCFFLNALASMTELSGRPSPPAVMVDMGGAVLDVPLVSLARTVDIALVMNTLFVDDKREVKAVFLVMPDMPSLKAILDVVDKRWQSK